MVLLVRGILILPIRPCARTDRRSFSEVDCALRRLARILWLCACGGKILCFDQSVERGLQELNAVDESQLRTGCTSPCCWECS